MIVGCSTGTGPGDQLPADPLLIETITEVGTTRNDLFTIRPDGSDRRSIWSEVRGFGYSTLFLRYSFDRTRIAFFQPGTPVIQLRNRQGSDLGSIAVLTGDPVFLLRWYFDDAHLVVSCGGTCQKWLIALDGSRVPLSLGGAEPEWSRDGRFVAVMEEDAQRVPQVFVMNSDGSNGHHITTGTDAALGPRWSPDGQLLLFWSANAIWTISPNGGLPYQLATAVAPPPVLNAPGHAWSPDGQWVAFRHQGQLHIVRSDGTGERLVPIVGALAAFDW